MQTATKPDFICIGPTKTGTTWLYHMLGLHPQVWLPPHKELCYFSEGNVVPAHSLYNVFFSRNWHYAAMRRKLSDSIGLMRLRERILCESYANPRWVYRFCFGSRSADWYTNLFLPDPKRLAGDISPSYYELPEQKIREISELNSQIKILMFLRNPIERAWSLALMVVLKNKEPGVVRIDHTEFRKVFDGIIHTQRSYVESIEIWKANFPDVFVAYFDTLEEDPVRFYNEVCAFLGVESNAIASALLQERVNAGLDLAMPTELADYLREHCYDEIVSLKQYCQSKYPQAWLDKWYP